VLEKPFGHDLNSARQLNQTVLRTFDESNVYRIDHYLGKETVQNILVFRFGNSLFEPVWNRNYVDYVEITAAETVGVENRASFYEETGALRDMVANHMLQLVALTAMEPPIAFDTHAVRARVPTAKFGMPDVAGAVSWLTEIADQWPSIQAPSRVTTLTHHYYFGGPATNPDVNIPNLLKPATMQKVQNTANIAAGAVENRLFDEAAG
jgi:hypothetical protein